jgi:hypothetical protein
MLNFLPINQFLGPEHNMSRQLTSLIVGIGLLAGCTPEAPPARTVTEFVENPILLEAAMLRCAKDRATSKYEQECINAREAVNRIQAKEEQGRREELEARSERKRQALRRTQQAAAEVRRRSEEAERLRKEAEYLAQFGVLPPSEDDDAEDLPEGNLPIAVVPKTEEPNQSTGAYGDALPAVDGGNAPVGDPKSEEELATDLDAVREELRRRSEEDTN